MTTAYTNLLGLALPVTGDLNGTWGDVVNNSITELVEDAIAGSATASVTSGNWTLTTTGSGAANQARSAILIPTGSPGVTRSILAPNSSKAYVIDNQSDAAVVIKGVTGPTTGASIAANTAALVAWDGTDFVLVSQDLSNSVGVLPVSKGGTAQTSYTNGQLLIGNTSGNTLTKSTLTAGSGIAITNGAGSISISTSGVGTVTSVAASVPTFLSVAGSPITTSGTLAISLSGTALPVANGGTGQTSYTDGQILIGNTTGNTLSKSTLTAGTGISVTNGSGAVTIAATNNGTVTSVAATAGTGISVTGSPITSSGTFNITNTAPDQVVSLTGAGTSVVTGTYPNFTITSNDSTTGTVTSVGASVPSFLSLSGSPITTSGTLAIGYSGTALPVANGGTGATSTAAALTSLGAYPASNPNGYTSNTGTVTSVGGTGTVNGISLSGTVTTSGSLTLGGTLSGVSLTTQVAGTLPIANGGTGATSAATALTSLGAYPAANPSGFTSNTGTVTSVAATAGTGISITGSPITTSGTLNIVNTAPDQTVAIAAGTGISVSGTYPSFTITNTASGGGTVTAVTGTAPVVSSGGATPAISMAAATTSVDGYLTSTDWNTFNNKTSNTGTVTSVGASVPSFLSVSGSPITTSGTFAISYSGVALPIANGGTGATTNSGARTNLGATTLGSNLFTVTNPSAITFPQFNADNTVSSLDASTFRTAIGAGTGSGTVTSVGSTGTVNGITLTGTVTSSGSLTLGGALSGVSLTTQVTGTLPVANGGTGITSFGSGIATFLGTPSSANLAAAVTDETGTGSLVFGTSPTVSGPTINDGYTEEVFAASGTTPALSPTNASIQTWTLSGNSTPTSGTWAAGQSITLMIDDGSAFTITWSSLAVTWTTDGGVAPTLNTSGYTAITLWKVGTTIYGARVGNA